MKVLISLVLICGLWGQDSIGMYSLPNDYWIAAEIRDDLTRGKMSFWRIEFIKLYEQYEAECYDDSTAHYYYTLCDLECWDIPCEKDEKINIWSEMECPEHWIHKEPTFKGFMEWL